LILLTPYCGVRRPRPPFFCLRTASSPALSRSPWSPANQDLRFFFFSVKCFFLVFREIPSRPPFSAIAGFLRGVFVLCGIRRLWPDFDPEFFAGRTLRPAGRRRRFVLAAVWSSWTQHPGFFCPGCSRTGKTSSGRLYSVQHPFFEPVIGLFSWGILFFFFFINPWFPTSSKSFLAALSLLSSLFGFTPFRCRPPGFYLIAFFPPPPLPFEVPLLFFAFRFALFRCVCRGTSPFFSQPQPP